MEWVSGYELIKRVIFAPGIFVFLWRSLGVENKAAISSLENSPFCFVVNGLRIPVAPPSLWNEGDKNAEHKWSPSSTIIKASTLTFLPRRVPGNKLLTSTPWQEGLYKPGGGVALAWKISTVLWDEARWKPSHISSYICLWPQVEIIFAENQTTQEHIKILLKLNFEIGTKYLNCESELCPKTCLRINTVYERKIDYHRGHRLVHDLHK